jgi:hypothetical protein
MGMWVWISQPKNDWNENFKVDPPHIFYHLPFESNSLLKC